MATRKPTTHFYKEGIVATPRFPQPTKLTPQQQSVLRRNYFIEIVKRKKKMNKKRIYNRNQAKKRKK